MQGIFRTVVLSVTGLVILAMAALGFFLATFDPNQYLDQMGAAVKKATGKELRLEAPVEVALFPHPGIKTGRALLLDDPAFGPDPFLSVESASLAIALEPLFDGVLAIEDVSVSGARLKLVRGLDGRGNRERAPQNGAKRPEPGVTPLPPPPASAKTVSEKDASGTAKTARKRLEARIDGISVTELAVSYHDEAGAVSFSAAVDKLELRNVNPGADIPLRLSGRLRDDRSGRRGEFTCDASARFSAAGDVAARIKSLRLAVDGFAETPLVLEGAAEAAYVKQPESLTVSGLAASLALAQRRAALEGDLTWRAAVPGAETAASLTGALRFGDLDIDGWLADLRNPLPDEDAAAAKGAPNMTKPKVARHKTPGQTTYLAGQAKPGDSEQAAANDRDLTAGIPDMELALSAASLTIEGLPLRQASATVTVANGKAEVPYTCLLYGGAIEGRLRAAPDGKAVSAALVCSVKNLDLGQATAARGGSYSVTGLLDASLDVAGGGSDAQAVMHSLKGKMSARAKGGEIRGFTLIPPDLRGLKPVPVNFSYASMSASAVITDGTANSRDISLVSKTLTGRGGGIVRLAFKQLDIGVDFMLAGLPPAVPVAISGPFNSLSTSIDMRTFLRNVAEAGVNAPADAAKGMLRGVGDLLFR